jgi:hypothetical protein
MEITKAEWKLMLQESIDAIRAEVDKEMPLSGIQILLTIPDKGLISFREVERQTDLPHSTCSRSLALLAGLSRIRVSDFKPVIEFIDDATDRRVRSAVFTAYGKEVMDKVFQRVATRLARVKSFTTNKET